MKKKEISKLSNEDLEKKASELKLELMTLQGQAATGTPPKNPGRIKQIKRILAKLNTKQAQKLEEKK